MVGGRGGEIKIQFAKGRREDASEERKENLENPSWAKEVCNWGGCPWAKE